MQNPSLALTSLVTLVRPWFGYFLIVDAHNEGIRPFDRPYLVVRWLSRWLLKAADLTIVSNQALATDVRRAGGHVTVLPDALPEASSSVGEAGSKSVSTEVAVIATYRPDEPIDEIMIAAESLPLVHFTFTGPAEKYRAGVPSNVSLSGFLDDDKYWRLLARADVVCDLTKKDDCLVCGAYEALALGKAMVLSDNAPTRELFGDVAEVTDNSAGDITRALERAIERQRELERAADSMRDVYPRDWRIRADETWATIAMVAANRKGDTI